MSVPIHHSRERTREEDRLLAEFFETTSYDELPKEFMKLTDEDDDEEPHKATSVEKQGVKTG